MSSIDDYKKRVSGSIKSSIIKNTKKVLQNSFTNSPSYVEVTINSSLTLIGVQVVDDSDVRDQKRITSIDTLLANGDIVEWQGKKWINVLTDNMGDGLYYRGILRLCLGSIKWLNEEGILQQSYFTFKSDPATNFGIDFGRIITTGNERRTLVVGSDNETKLIGKGKRFIFDSRTWKVTAVDTISVEGLVMVTVEEDEINLSVDNLSLGVADYFGKVANYTLTILNETSFSIHAGSTLQLNTEVRNNGTIVSKPIIYESNNPSIATVNNTGLVTTIANGTVTITAKLADDPSVMDSIIGNVQFVVVNNYTVSLIEGETVTKGTSKTFTVQVKNNGVVDSNKYVNWYLFADDKVSTTSNAQMTFSSTTQCTLKGLEVGYVQLKVIIIGESQPYWIRVQIKGLF